MYKSLFLVPLGIAMLSVSVAVGIKAYFLISFYAEALQQAQAEVSLEKLKQALE